MKVYVVFASGRFDTVMMRVFDNKPAAEDMAEDIRAGRHNLGEGWEAFVTEEAVFTFNRPEGLAVK